LSTYLDWRKLPAVPHGDFGHSNLIDEWGMLANDKYGCCAWAGAAHQTALWTAEGGDRAPFTDQAVLSDYSAATGFAPSDPATDNGTDVQQMARYWQQTGVVDANGERHKIVAYADLTPGDLRELWAATYLFQSVGLGFALPESAERQFAAGEPWDVVRGARIIGGHYVPCVGRKGGKGLGVTWGKVQPFTADFYERFNNQGLVAFSEEMLIAGHNIDGFDDELLREDLAHFKADD
jgi:hypothetical protein